MNELYSHGKINSNKLKSFTVNSMFASCNALILLYIRETINFAAIIHHFLISKNRKNKMYYFGLLSIFYKAGIYNVHL